MQFKLLLRSAERKENIMAHGDYVAREGVLMTRTREDTCHHETPSLEHAMKRYLPQAAPCPLCRTPAERLSWMHLTIPEWAWDTLGERACWITVCDRCKLQIDLFR